MATHEIGHEANENAGRRFTRRAAPKTLLLAVALGLALGLGASAPTDVSALPKRSFESGKCYYQGAWYSDGAILVHTDGKQYICQWGSWVPKGSGTGYA